MKKIFILLIVVLLFTILYGYYYFSNNVKKLLTFKEGINSNVQSLLTSSYSISTEQGFYSYIKDMYAYLNNGMVTNQGNNNIPSIPNSVEINKNAMISISKYSYILSQIDQKPYNDLIATYPNLIQNATYDIQQLNKMFYSSTVLNSIISSGSVAIIDNVTYNCLLGYLQAYYESIVYFNNKQFPLIEPDKISTKGDDFNTKYIDNIQVNPLEQQEQQQ